MRFLRKTLDLMRMVKIEHSVFALPYAYMGAFIAWSGLPPWAKLGWLTLAMVAVRSFAMAFNRLADLRFDRSNPRTRTRPLVTGRINKAETVIFLAATAVVFILACAALNRICLVLAVPALLYSALYSFTKRFTVLCHFYLGSVLALAPLAGRMAVSPGFTPTDALLFLGVTYWVAGFDILYACQDVDFDRKHSLRSIPAVFGIPTALAISSFCHVTTPLFFLIAGFTAWLAWPYYAVCLLAGAVLILEHRIISAEDMSRINTAFFTLNGFIAVGMFVGTAAAVL